MADQRWRNRPRVMSRQTVDHLSERIAEHAHAHGLPTVDVVLHGGEPLLAGPAHIEYCVRRIRSAAGSDVTVRMHVQTNGTRLDPAFLRLFDILDVRVGVSLDGDRTGHDRHRRDPSGAGSHARVSAALRLLSAPAHRRLFGGLLCTVDLRSDPVRSYQALLEFAPPTVDFLLPHGNWSAPPPGRHPGSAETPYADWLAAVFDRWYGAPQRETSVRLFDSVIALLLGGRSSVEGWGLDPVPMVVVQTDGTVERSDVLAATADGAAATGLHVARDPFDAMLAPGLASGPSTAQAPLPGVSGLAPACRRCAVRRICGGGLPAHRYRDGSFINPSVYCPDLYGLVRHIRRRVAQDVASLQVAR